MKTFLRQGLARRFGYDGWALQVRGATQPLEWTTSTTRAEAREILRELKAQDLAWGRLKVVKVRINVEPISG